MSTDPEAGSATPNNLTGMTRREALTRIAWLMGGTLIAAQPFLHGTRLEGKELAPEFSADDLALMAEIGETIIPTTTTPGAKAAGIGAFMALMVADCYNDAHQALFKSGLKQIDSASRKRFGKSFLQATPEQRTELCVALDQEQKTHRMDANGMPHYFRLFKELTLVGYFTSEIGATQALRYIEVPGRFDGNVTYHKGEPAWFTQPSRNLI